MDSLNRWAEQILGYRLDWSATALLLVVLPIFFYLAEAAKGAKWARQSIENWLERWGPGEALAGAFLVGALVLQVVAIHDRDGWFGQSTAAWMQAIGSVGAIGVAVWIDQGAARRAEAARVGDERRYDAFVFGVCAAAVHEICGIAEALAESDMGRSIAEGHVPHPTMAGHIQVLRVLDLDRLAAPEAALGVAEIRRLAGWAKGYVGVCVRDYSAHGTNHPDFDETLITWRSNAETALRTLKSNLRAEKKSMLGG